MYVSMCAPILRRMVVASPAIVAPSAVASPCPESSAGPTLLGRTGAQAPPAPGLGKSPSAPAAPKADADYCSKASGAPESLEALCARVDADADGWISKLDLLEATRRDGEVARLVLPGAGPGDEEDVFDALEAMFEAVAKGKRRARVADLVAQVSKTSL